MSKVEIPKYTDYEERVIKVRYLKPEVYDRLKQQLDPKVSALAYAPIEVGEGVYKERLDDIVLLLDLERKTEKVLTDLVAVNFSD